MISASARRDSRTQLLTDIRQRWEELGNDWSTALLLWDGGRTYYSDAPVGERQRVAALVDRYEDPDAHTTDPLFSIRAETAGVRRVSRFFAYAADAVLRGRLGINDVYAVFGPDVARHHQAALWIAGRESLHAGRATFYDVRSRYPEWAVTADNIPESGFYDEQEAVVLLLWLCAGVQSRRGDSSAHLILERARYFRRSGEWRRVASSMWRLSLSRGQVPWRPVLQFCLRSAASIPPSAATAPAAEPLFNPEHQLVANARLRRQIRSRH